MNAPTPQKPDQKPGLISGIVSALAALIGIQSSRNRERDFKRAKPEVLIFGGMIAVMLFIVCVLFAVRVAMQHASQ
ncbi:MAG: DUF2970 domain-containing protein [Stagnimonas sp.]|nr:DUF2970 domain-containing protein [Stagnimonas sp.]